MGKFFLYLPFFTANKGEIHEENCHPLILYTVNLGLYLFPQIRSNFITYTVLLLLLLYLLCKDYIKTQVIIWTI